MNTEELSTSLAAEIAAKHREALTVASQARENIDKAKDRYHNRLHEWLRQYVPSLPVEQADVYLGIHNRRLKRQVFEADSAQLKLIGVLGDEEVNTSGGSSTAQRADGGRWIKWAGHIAQHFREVDETRPIEIWESFERKALADTLEPMVALYKRAGGMQ